MTSLEPGTFTDVADWAEWLRSLDPITAIRVGSILMDGTTTKRLAAVVDEITYAQTIAGGGTMTQAELADVVGDITQKTIARRAGRHRAAQRNPTTWTAILAPVGVDAPDGRCLEHASVSALDALNTSVDVEQCLQDLYRRVDRAAPEPDPELAD